MIKLICFACFALRYVTHGVEQCHYAESIVAASKGISMVQQQAVVKKDELDEPNIVQIIMGGYEDRYLGEQGGAWRMGQAKVALPSYRRAMWSKAVRCTDSSMQSCTECWDTQDCWTGTAGKGTALVVSDAGSMWQRFITSMHVHCETSELHLTFKYFRVSNGDLHTYWDEVEMTEANGFTLNWQKNTRKAYRMKQKLFVTVPLETPGGHELSIEFVPTGPRGDVNMKFAIFVDESYKTCQDAYTCLSVFEAREIEDRELRYNNVEQLQCLNSTAALTDLDPTCQAWRECLESANTDHRHILINVLAAAGVSGTSQVNAPSGQDDHVCFNPAIEDAESLDCDCYEEAQEKCARIETVTGYSEERCLRALFCSTPAVCDFWKSVYCAEPWVTSLQAALDQVNDAVDALVQERSSRGFTKNRDMHDLEGGMGTKACM